MDFDRNDLNREFSLPGELLQIRDCPPIHLIVSGGAAIIATGIAGRSTHDVDVIALRGEVDGEIMPSWPLPEFFKDAVSEVGRELGLTQNWVNATTSLLMIRLEKLPGELWSELVTEEYGPKFAVSFIGRVGLIYLKLWAAMERDEERDMVDLRALQPTHEEISHAGTWLVSLGLIPPTRLRELEDLEKGFRDE